ncbi:MAG: non-ribosomal peptide synthetase, partial [Betaproteobacteria bacterium]
MLAVLKAGGAYLPLDPNYPSERLAFILNDAKVKLMISEQAHYDLLELSQSLATDAPTLIDLQDPFIEVQLTLLADTMVDDSVRSTPLLPGHLAYVIYTSGSTGMPKGVGVSHQGIANLACAQTQRFGLSHQHRLLQFASQAFDASISEITTAWLSGATLVIPSVEKRSEQVTDLMNTLKRYEITHATLPPALLGEVSAEDLQGLETLVVAGEACAPALVQRFASHVRMINAYGPTEVTVCGTMSAPLDAQSASESSTVPIGHPIANTNTYVLDAAMELVPDGVVGELYIAGPGLARGYLNRSGLTAERFVANPFMSGARMYRTGDLVRRRTDLNLEFMGRVDEQVKVRGFRIELGEIEAALAQGLGQSVSHVAVIARERQGAKGVSDKYLVAYLVKRQDDPSTGQLPSDAEIRSMLSRTLPDYMVPAAFVQLESLPLTPNGKLDRRALPDPDLSADQSTYRAPVSEHEVLLCELFAQVTGASRVGLDDSFFAIGGDSISAMRLIGKVRHAGLSLSIRDLFEYPTAAALVKYLSTIAEDQNADQALWSPEGNVPALPVYRQFLELGDGLDRFNQAMRLEAPAGMTYESAREILSRLRAHHAALRLRICGTSPAVFLIDPVDQLAPLELKVLDVTNLSADMQSAAIDQTFEALSNDLHPDRPGAMQACCWVNRGSDVAPLLLWVIHHFAVDGVSWRILLQDLRLLTYAQQDLQGSYAQRTTQSLLPAPTISLRQWASMLEAIGKDSGRRIEEPLWLAQLERAPALPRDIQIAAKDNTNEHAAELHLALNETQTRTLLKS